MKYSTEGQLELLNRKGKQYRKMLLPLTDEELRNLFPTPSAEVMRKLKYKIARMERMRRARN